MMDLQGQVFGRLTVVRVEGREHGGIMWLCVCSCGVEVVRSGPRLRYARNREQMCKRCAAGRRSRHFEVKREAKQGHLKKSWTEMGTLYPPMLDIDVDGRQGEEDLDAVWRFLVVP